MKQTNQRIKIGEARRPSTVLTFIIIVSERHNVTVKKEYIKTVVEQSSKNYLFEIFFFFRFRHYRNLLFTFATTLFRQTTQAQRRHRQQNSIICKGILIIQLFHFIRICQLSEFAFHFCNYIISVDHIGTEETQVNSDNCNPSLIRENDALKYY